MKSGILQINEKGLIYNDIMSKSLIGKIKEGTWKEDLGIKGKSIDDIKIDFHSRNIFIIVQGEQIYVKLIQIPKVSKRKLNSIIKTELRYHFKSIDIDNIMFTYDVFKDNGKSLEIIVFCLNWDKDNIIEKCVEKGANVKGVYPIQFCILNNYKKIIKEHEYILAFLYDNKLYLLACIDGKIFANSVVQDVHIDNFEQIMDKFKEKCRITGVIGNLKNIFLLNLPYQDIVKTLYKKYNCNDLGTICKDKLEVI
ncbi:hypothetical protein [Clostridium drakei]|uniref:Uncharacterized protein n=1 Tax=Clostridium drakei TaxID=332101 RepID=A0A2U8DMX0_9CLOT|nr:hypothetical protein [Clostridium drakei]AWI03771.1 hypothetical protein B9W14_04465 [Clostridium drakei]